MRLAIAFVLAGCWTSTPVVTPTMAPSEPEPQLAAGPPRRPVHYRSPCEVAIDRIVDVSRDEIEKIPDFADKINLMRDAGVASCQETRWADDVARCFADANETSDLAPCQTKLTPDQTNDLMKRISEVMSSSTP